MYYFGMSEGAFGRISAHRVPRVRVFNVYQNWLRRTSGLFGHRHEGEERTIVHTLKYVGANFRHANMYV